MKNVFNIIASLCTAVLITMPDDLVAMEGGASIHNQTGIKCQGEARQGGIITCLVSPTSAKVKIHDMTLTPDSEGFLTIAFPRAADESYAIHVLPEPSDGPFATFVVQKKVKKRDWKIERIDGLPSNKVNKFTDQQLVKIKQATKAKKVAFKKLSQHDGWKNGFTPPVEKYRRSGVFGSQRVLNGEPKRPHLGIDYAAPRGTIVSSPAPGVITLAQDLYFEGSSVFIDHGGGLMSVMMHLSEINVKPGDKVVAGQKVGEIGATGRATGPHLHWGIKWNNKYYIDPESVFDVAFDQLK